jgi:hypothetical protein
MYMFSQIIFREYLLPQPANSMNMDNWNAFQKIGFRFVQDEHIAHSFFSKITDSDSPTRTLESVLLLMEALKNSCINDRLVRFFYITRLDNRHAKIRLMLF